jgi:hypothetical protein
VGGGSAQSGGGSGGGGTPVPASTENYGNIVGSGDWLAQQNGYASSDAYWSTVWSTSLGMPNHYLGSIAAAAIGVVANSSIGQGLSATTIGPHPLGA